MPRGLEESIRDSHGLYNVVGGGDYPENYNNTGLRSEAENVVYQADPARETEKREGMKDYYSNLESSEKELLSVLSEQGVIDLDGLSGENVAEILGYSLNTPEASRILGVELPWGHVDRTEYTAEDLDSKDISKSTVP